MTQERGAVMPLTALLMVVLVGMVAFATDLGWLFLNANRTQKAADAAALGGVVYMPSAFDQATAVALEVASDNAYIDASLGGDATVVPSKVTGFPNRLDVEITREVPTFFMRLFGVGSVDITKNAIAEMIPPVRMGGRDTVFGYLPDGYPNAGSAGDGFWLAINGRGERRQNGDPWNTACGHDCGDAGGNPWRDERLAEGLDGYYYAVDVPAGTTSVTVTLFDPGMNTGISSYPGLPAGQKPNDSGSITPTYFQLFQTDNTPYDPRDNPPAPGCSATYAGSSALGWIDLCTILIPTGGGIFPLQITTGDTGAGRQVFSIQVSGNGPRATTVYGLGSMSIWSNQADISSRFELMEITETYRGRQVLLRLFDPGDVQSGSSATLRIIPDAPTGVTCSYTDHNGSPQTQTGTCSVVTATPSQAQLYNGKWLEILFQIPADYACSTDCWWDIDYLFTGTPTERTTWTAGIPGSPVRLVFDDTP